MDTCFTHFDRIYYGRKRNLSPHFNFFRTFFLMDSATGAEDSVTTEDAECPLCLDPLKSHICIRTHCCEKFFHLDCYMHASLETCPMCRAPQPRILPVTVFKTDWPRITTSVCLTILVAACVSISVLLVGNCGSSRDDT